MSSAEISGKHRKPPDGWFETSATSISASPRAFEVLLGNAAIRDGFMDRRNGHDEREAAAAEFGTSGESRLTSMSIEVFFLYY